MFHASGNGALILTNPIKTGCYKDKQIKIILQDLFRDYTLLSKEQ